MKKLLFILILFFFIGYSRCYWDWRGEFHCYDTDTDTHSRCYQDWRGDWYCNNF